MKLAIVACCVSLCVASMAWAASDATQRMKYENNPCRLVTVDKVLFPINTAPQQIRASLPAYDPALVRQLAQTIPHLAERLNNPADKERYSLMFDISGMFDKPGAEMLLRQMMRNDPYSMLQHQAAQKLMLCWRPLARDAVPAAYFHHAGLVDPGPTYHFVTQIAALRAASANQAACACGMAELGPIADILGLAGDGSDVPRLQALGACNNPYVATRAAYALYNRNEKAAAEKILRHIADDPAADLLYRAQARALLAAPDAGEFPLPAGCGG